MCPLVCQVLKIAHDWVKRFHRPAGATVITLGDIANIAASEVSQRTDEICSLAAKSFLKTKIKGLNMPVRRAVFSLTVERVFTTKPFTHGTPFFTFCI